MSMTESEATKLHVGIIGSGRKYPRSVGEYMDSIEELEQYRAIGTVSEFRQLKEKAKKAEWIFDDFTAKFGNPYRCSNCEEEFGDTYNYCPNCGCDMYAD